MLTFLIIIIAILSFIAYVKWRHSYWKRRGVAQLNPEFFFGNSRKVLTGKTSLAEIVLERYSFIKDLQQRAGGIYSLLEPIYYPIDPSLIKIILHKDFGFFMDRGLFNHTKDVLSMNIFNMEGDAWRTLRAKLSPTFTSGKIKMMLEILVEKTDSLEKLVDKYINDKQPFAIKEVLGSYTTDIIASCAFGIECDSLENPSNLFRTYGKKVFESNLLKFCIPAIFPWWFLGYIGYKSNGSDVSNFFTQVVKETIRTREANHIFRKDFMHLLLELKDQQSDSDSTKNNDKTQAKNTYSLTDDEIVAQCFIFFLAGFETSSTTMTFALLELAQNPEIQEKLRQEINAVLQKYNGKITYDAITEMSYLEKVINETLRKFSPAPALPRICTKNYKIPGTDTVIEKGTKVHIPIWGLHRDPEYYPDPERFDPERFNEENKAKRPDCTFIPFGEGPRRCIGLRFGMIEAKVGLVSLVRNFSFSLNEKTPFPLHMSSGSFITSVKGEVWLDATRIEKN